MSLIIMRVLENPTVQPTSFVGNVGDVAATMVNRSLGINEP
ncbi:hypothetical protein [Sphingobium chlorophenolicum]|nr:hypothetical protein [Sphingobium chlorophenolicum]